ncbi:MAG: YdcH family protein [Bryobacteraceae bacterium]
MHSHSPGQILSLQRRTDSATPPNTGAPLMENHTQEEELKAHLLSTDQQFRSLCEQHAQLKHQIEEIELKPHVTEADELEEQRLKKLKLYIKDQMNSILAQSRQIAVS